MENEKSRRPADTPFKQQRMTAWQPVLTPIKVILIFFVIGIVFIPVGVTLLDESNAVSCILPSNCSVFMWRNNVVFFLLIWFIDL